MPELKTVSGRCTAKCRECGCEFEYEDRKSEYFESFVPTVCDRCFLINEKAEAILEEKHRIQDIMSMSAGYSQDISDWPEWNNTLGNKELRNNIGKAMLNGNKLSGERLWLWSKKSGVNKTYSCIDVCRTAIKRGIPVLLWEWNNLQNRYSTKCGDNRGEAFTKYMQNFKSLLFIDDIGVGPLTTRGVELLYAIFNVRYNKKLPTLITSNYKTDGADGISKWITRFSPADADRISRRMKNLCTVIEVN